MNNLFKALNDETRRKIIELLQVKLQKSSKFQNQVFLITLTF